MLRALFNGKLTLLSFFPILDNNRVGPNLDVTFDLIDFFLTTPASLFPMI